MLKTTVWLYGIILAVNVVAALAAPGRGPDPPMGHLLVGVGALFVALLWGLVLGANLLWDCLGCYQCQEHCPQAVGVADVIYELKNVAIGHAAGIASLRPVQGVQT